MGNEGRSGGPQGSKSTRSSEEPLCQQPGHVVLHRLLGQVGRPWAVRSLPGPGHRSAPVGRSAPPIIFTPSRRPPQGSGGLTGNTLRVSTDTAREFDLVAVPTDDPRTCFDLLGATIPLRLQ